MADSDDSFAWDKASKTSEDSDYGSLPIRNMKDVNMDGYESEKSYKRKLQKQLFNESGEEYQKKEKKKQIKNESIEDDPETRVEINGHISDTPRKKARKSHVKQEKSDEEYKSRQENVPKKHNTSIDDSPQKRKKKKRTKSEHPDTESIREELQESESTLSSNIDAKTPKKKKKRHTKEEHEDDLEQKVQLEEFKNIQMNESLVKKGKKRRHKEEEPVGNESQDELDGHNEGNEPPRKKSKKKQLQHKENHEFESTNMSDSEYLELQIKKERVIASAANTDSEQEMVIEDKFTAEETVVETRRERHNSVRATKSKNTEIKAKVADSKKSKEKEVSYTSKEFISDDSSSDESTAAGTSVNKSIKQENSAGTRRDSENTRRNSGVTRRDSGATGRVSRVTRRDSGMTRRDSGVTRRDSGVTRRNSEVSRRDSEVSRRNSEVSRRDSEVSRRDSEVSRRDSEVSRRDSEKTREIPTTRNIASNNRTSKGNRLSTSRKEATSDEDDSDDITAGKGAKVKPKTTNLSANKSVRQDDSDSDDSTGRNQIENQNRSGRKSQSFREKSPEKQIKLSDRITFEDEDDSSAEATESNNVNVNKLTKLLRQYLKANPNLRISDLKLETFITKDDDVWLLHCPQEFDISCLQDKDLVLESKCKVKVNGQRYDGTMEEGIRNVAILIEEDRQPVILNAPLAGTINFRKRLPKPHFVEDNVIVNNQTDFIPLPNTKCRHPLFGADYKKAIKIPTAVKIRLNAVNEEPSTPGTDTKKKKKHKKHSHSLPEDEAAIEIKVESTHFVDHAVKKKKRKHKEIEEDEQPKRKAKRSKVILDSAEAWESERDIEENLFNY